MTIYTSKPAEKKSGSDVPEPVVVTDPSVSKFAVEPNSHPLTHQLPPMSPILLFIVDELSMPRAGWGQLEKMLDTVPNHCQRQRRFDGDLGEAEKDVVCVTVHRLHGLY